MTDQIVGAGFGRTVALGGPAEAVAAAKRTLPFWWVPSTHEPEQTFHVATAEMSSHVVRAMELWVAEFAVDRVFVHAAVVAVDGRAIVLPGRSRSGKTTMCVELLRRGAAYVSDEYAALDASGRVHPYPRPLQVRRPGSRVATAAISLGAPVVEHPLPIGLVAALKFEEKSGWAVTPMTSARTAIHLLDNTVCARSRPAEASQFIATAVGGVRGVEGRRGPAAEAAGPLLTLVKETDR